MFNNLLYPSKDLFLFHRINTYFTVVVFEFDRHDHEFGYYDFILHK